MKWKMLSALCAVAAAWSLNAVEPDPFINQTLSHVDANKMAPGPVDLNGRYLYYHNAQGITDFVNKLPVYADDLLLAADEKDPLTRKKVKEGLEIFLRLLNLSALKSYAESETLNTNGEYCFKTYAHFGPKGMKQPSLLHFFSSEKNHPLETETLPDDLVVALRFSCQLDKLYKAVMAELDKSVYYRDIFVQITQEAAKNNINLDEFLQSVSGDVVFTIAGKTVNDLDIQLTITDKQYKLAAELQKIYPSLQGKDYAVLAPKSGNYEPVLRYGAGKLTFASSPVVRKKTSARSKQKSPEGTGYFIVDVNQNLINSVGKEIKDPNLKALFEKYVKPFHVYSICILQPGGYLTTTQSNFSIADLFCSRISPMSSGVIQTLSALGRGKGTAKTAEQPNQK